MLLPNEGVTLHFFGWVRNRKTLPSPCTSSRRAAAASLRGGRRRCGRVGRRLRGVDPPPRRTCLRSITHPPPQPRAEPRDGRVEKLAQLRSRHNPCPEVVASELKNFGIAGTFSGCLYESPLDEKRQSEGKSGVLKSAGSVARVWFSFFCRRQVAVTWRRTQLYVTLAASSRAQRVEPIKRMHVHFRHEFSWQNEPKINRDLAKQSGGSRGLLCSGGRGQMWRGTSFVN